MSESAERPLGITILAVLAALLVLKELSNLFLDPLDQEVQVWFGYRFLGAAGKILTIPHLLVYGFAAFGLFRMTRASWWVAFGYLLYLPVSLILYLVFYGVDARWHLLFAAISIAIVAAIEFYLYRHRVLFTN